jgi:hypothetical protein
VNPSSGHITKTCELVFEHKLEQLRKTGDTEILLSYFGEITQELVYGLAERSEEILIGHNIKKKLIKRVFSILNEGLQNVYLHANGLPGNGKLVLVMFYKTGRNYIIELGNIIERHREHSVEERLNLLNALSLEDVRELYIKVLGDGIISNKGGAGLGFISMRLKAESQLETDFFELDNSHSLFVFQVKLEANQLQEVLV